MVKKEKAYLSSFTIDETRRVCRVLQKCLPPTEKKGKSTTNKFLRWLYSRIQTASKRVPSEFGTYGGPVLARKDIPKPAFPLGGDYMVSDFVRQIDDTACWSERGRFEIGGKSGSKKRRDVCINITYMGDELRSHSFYRDNASKMMKKMILWLNVVLDIARPQCSSTLDVYLYLLPEKKSVPSEITESIGPAHVNSAFADACARRSTIVIYREEEWFKVFIHETFHSFGLDFARYNTHDLEKRLVQITGLKMEFTACEMYTEMWARILNSCMTAYYCTDSRDEYLGASAALLTCERAYSIYQAVKIINFLGIASSQLLVNSKTNMRHRRMAYRERSHVFSYYIATAILMSQIPRFIDFCEIQSNDYFRFPDSPVALLSFSKLFEGLYSSEETLDAFECIESTAERNTRAQSRLRMSLIEMA